MAPRAKSDEIRRFIIDNVGEHPRDIAHLVCERFGITRQAVRRHLLILIEDDLIEATGNTRNREYHLKATIDLRTVPLADQPSEDRVWAEFAQPLLNELPDNVQKICHLGFTEILNNAIDHSEGTLAQVWIEKTPKAVTLTIQDDGVGIFEKIKTHCGLEDYRQAILELSKGKLTTDPDRHSGLGIFFTSRAFDYFAILSGHLYFSHLEGRDDWLIEDREDFSLGTHIKMMISRSSTRTTREVYDRYSGVEWGFSRTHVPLALAQYGSELLVSRSQAKRVLARFDQFKEVLLDFHGVETIGQAFADEIFRIFPSMKPDIQLIWVNANDQVERMIRLALATREEMSSMGKTATNIRNVKAPTPAPDPEGRGGMEPLKGK